MFVLTTDIILVKGRMYSMKAFSRSMTILLMALFVFVVFTLPSFAATGSGWYQPGTAVTYTNPIRVKIVLNSRQDPNHDYIQCVYDVTLGTYNMAPTSFTVGDALSAFDNQQNEYEVIATSLNTGSFYSFKKVSTNTIFGHALYMPYQIIGNTYYYPMDGWMFRVNGKIPTVTSSATNAIGLIAAYTNIKDGDVITYYTDCPWKINNVTYSTYFISAHSTYDDNNGVLIVNMKKSRDFFNGALESATWTIQNYTSYNPNGYHTATLYDDNGIVIGMLQLQDGYGEMNCTLNSNKEYYVSIDDCVSWHTIAGFDSAGSITNVDHLERTIAFDKVIH